MKDSEQKLPLHEDIMQLARLGEIGPIQKLLDEGKFKADYRDAENITPLHVRLGEDQTLFRYQETEEMSSGPQLTITTLSANTS